MTGAELERLLYHMRSLADNAPDPWERSFAKNMQRNGRKRGWWPTRKQAETMQRMVSDMFGEPDDALLTDDGAPLTGLDAVRWRMSLAQDIPPMPAGAMTRQRQREVRRTG